MKLPLYSVFFLLALLLSLPLSFCSPAITLLTNTVNSGRRLAGSIVCNIYRANNDPKQMGVYPLRAALLSKERESSWECSSSSALRHPPPQ